MSDVRTLLKAKRQEIRINHPLASYTSGGQLRCVVCHTNIKHPSAWDGHLGSKAHRTNSARVREERRREEELEEAKRLKRKISEDNVDGEIKSAAKRTKVASAPLGSTSNLPPDFFSDPSRAPLLLSNESDGEGEMDNTVTTAIARGGHADSALEQEWLQFQQTVVNASEPDAAITYDRATVVAEPELTLDPSEGFPASDASHTQSVDKSGKDERRRKEQEERELIMDRFMDEERAQEEADMKVAIMKNKLEALRKKREASRSAKSNVGVA